MVARYRQNVDYTSATAGTDDGHVVFTPNVNATVTGATADVTIVGPVGSRSAATSVSTTASTEDVARTGIITETAPATDTASSGLNGRLQRMAQRITSLIAQIPATLGPKTPALSLSMVPALLTPFAKAAGLTTSPFGATGAAGDYMSHVILQPAATAAGTTTIFNNATAVYVYTAGTLADLRPIIVPINAVSVGGSWNITSGTSMAATGFGTFT
jgi:hypothetical protein